MTVSIKYYLSKHKGKIAVLSGLAVLKALFAFAIPFITREILEIGENGSLPGPGTFLWFLGSLLALYAVNLSFAKYNLNFQKEFKEKESKFLFEKLMAVDLSYINKKKPGYFTGRIMTSLDHVYNLAGSFGTRFIAAALTVPVSLAFIFSIDVTLFALFTALLPLSYYSYKKLDRKLQENTGKMQAGAAASDRDMVNCTRDIFAFKQVFNYGKCAGKLKSRVQEQQKVNLDLNWNAQVLSQAIHFAVNLLKSAIIFLTVYFYLHNKMMVSELIFVYLIMTVYFSALTGLNSLSANKSDVKAAMEFIQGEILDHTEKDDGLMALQEIKNIRFDLEGFDYETKKNILKPLKLEIHKRQRVAIAGETGCGKSTLLKLMGRFYHGKNIFINNRNIDEYTLKSLRRKIYYSTGNAYIFPGTVKENITIGLDMIDEQRLDKIVAEPFFKKIMAELPDGLNSVIGEESVNLSGSQRQKIGIARAMMRQPELLILDESTSSMDSQGELQVYNSIEKYFPAATIIKISHRLPTVSDSDLIVVMKNGDIISSGSHSRLIKECSEYRKIFADQMENREVAA